jgi:Methyltransferase domain
MSEVTKTLEDRLNTLDLSLFEQIESQSSPDDRRSLLALHGACRDTFGEFSYLEIGSHMGGSLQSFLVDPVCSAIISIDPRPQVSPDQHVRGGIEIPDNSTQRMLALLSQLPHADLTKLRTIEASTADILPSAVSPAPNLCFIDGEHTNSAAYRDAAFCRAVLRLPGVIAFHDWSRVSVAIGRFLHSSEGIGYPLRGSIFVVELGDDRVFRHPLVRRMVPDARHWELANRVGVAHLLAGRPVERMRRQIRLRTRLRQLSTTTFANRFAKPS